MYQLQMLKALLRYAIMLAAAIYFSDTLNDIWTPLEGWDIELFPDIQKAIAAARIFCWSVVLFFASLIVPVVFKAVVPGLREAKELKPARKIAAITFELQNVFILALTVCIIASIKGNFREAVDKNPEVEQLSAWLKQVEALQPQIKDVLGEEDIELLRLTWDAFSMDELLWDSTSEYQKNVNENYEGFLSEMLPKMPKIIEEYKRLDSLQNTGGIFWQKGRKNQLEEGLNLAAIIVFEVAPAKLPADLAAAKENVIQQQRAALFAEPWTAWRYLLPNLKANWAVSLVWAMGIAIFLCLPIFSGRRNGRYFLAKWRVKYISDYIELAGSGQGGRAAFAGLLGEMLIKFRRWGKYLYMGRSLFNRFLEIGLDGETNMLTIAPAGSGKGTCAIIPNLYEWKHSAIVLDVKGENAYWTARYRRDVLGQDVHIIDPFSLIVGTSAVINPLDFLDPESETYFEDIKVITDALVLRTGAERNPYWNDSAEVILAGLIDFLVRSSDYPNPDLTMLRSLLVRLATDAEQLLAEMLHLSADGPAPEAAARIARSDGTEELAGIISNADTQTEFLRGATKKALAGPSDFSFADLKKKPTSVYCIVDASRISISSRFLRLLVNTAIKQIMKSIKYTVADKAAEVPVMMFLDEFLQLQKLKEVEAAMSLARGYNLMLWIFIQDLASFQDIYGEKAVYKFINNCRAVQVFGAMDPVTTGFISEFLNKRKYAAGWGEKPQSVPLRAPDEVRIELAVEKRLQYLLRAGKKAVLCERVPYYEHRIYKKIAEKYEGWIEVKEPAIMDEVGGDGRAGDPPILLLNPKPDDVE